MKKIALDDILGFNAYEKVRQEFRQKIIELKKIRRVSIGAKISAYPIAAWSRIVSEASSVASSTGS
jgi:hypothetical protein